MIQVGVNIKITLRTSEQWIIYSFNSIPFVERSKSNSRISFVIFVFIRWHKAVRCTLINLFLVYLPWKASQGKLAVEPENAWGK